MLDLYLPDGRYLRRVSLAENETKETIFQKLRSIRFEIIEDHWPEKLVIQLKEK